MEGTSRNPERPSKSVAGGNFFRKDGARKGKILFGVKRSPCEGSWWPGRGVCCNYEVPSVKIEHFKNGRKLSSPEGMSMRNATSWKLARVARIQWYFPLCTPLLYTLLSPSRAAPRFPLLFYLSPFPPRLPFLVSLSSSPWQGVPVLLSMFFSSPLPPCLTFLLVFLSS